MIPSYFPSGETEGPQRLGRSCPAPGWLCKCSSQSLSLYLCLQTCLTRAGGAQIKGAGPALLNLPTEKALSEDVVILSESGGAAGRTGERAVQAHGMCGGPKLGKAEGKEWVCT